MWRLLCFGGLFSSQSHLLKCFQTCHLQTNICMIFYRQLFDILCPVFLIKCLFHSLKKGIFTLETCVFYIPTMEQTSCESHKGFATNICIISFLSERYCPPTRHQTGCDGSGCAGSIIQPSSSCSPLKHLHLFISPALLLFQTGMNISDAGGGGTSG